MWLSDTLGILTFHDIGAFFESILAPHGTMKVAAGLFAILLALFLVQLWKDQFLRTVLDTSIRQTLFVSCMFMWIILAALGFGAVFDGLGCGQGDRGLLRRPARPRPVGNPPLDAAFLPDHGHLPRRHGDAGDRRAALCAAGPGARGFDLIWYGVLYTITCQIAYMTPPFGYNLFLMRAMAPKEVGLSDIYRSIVPFVLVMLVGLALITAFPQIALWLPNYVYGK